MKTLLKIFVIVLLLGTVMINAQEKAKIKVACIGNSITEGAGWGDKTYPAQVGVLLGSDYNVKNFGLSGRTMLKKGDYPYWNENLFALAKEFNPDIIILMLGTNDSKPQNWKYKEEFFKDYADMIKAFRKNDRNPKIYVCLPPPVFKDGYGINNSIIHDQIIPMIDSIKNKYNTLLIDFNTAMINDSSYFVDGIHPNGEGYGIMAKIVYNAIKADEKIGK